MRGERNTPSAPTNAKTQRARILRLLIEARGWVPLPELIACAAQYNARVLELRRLGFAIENKTERVNGERHSWFRLVSSPAPAPKPEPAKPNAAAIGDDLPLFQGVRS